MHLKKYFLTLQSRIPRQQLLFAKKVERKEIKLAKVLEDKYGNGEISLETGEFLPSK